ncbi:Vegetative incompatibility protein HET-E-1 [Ceratocystis lukuohia]|uniref:Vegetative incompatibility protein HET-E-1 n=1 Tax=Ceratocystis lukuohia TaxID=2019550 RepID=A0ABR4M8N9_9PEZI
MNSSMTQTTGPPVWLLSLDGGGINALSSLLILERIMECIQESEGLSETPRPCDRFDFIGGTGIGGIIAIMLGRLKMSCDDSVREYKSIVKAIFDLEPTLSSTIPTDEFSATRLEAAIKRMIRNNCTDPNCLQRKTDGHITGTDTCPHEDMLFADETCTKTAVLAMRTENLDTLPTLFKTYHIPRCLTGCKVWEVVRATSAGIALSDPITLGLDKIEFIGASYAYYNPCEALISEAESQFPGRNIMILSIGAGRYGLDEIGHSKDFMRRARWDMVPFFKHIHLKLKNKYDGLGVYYRFDFENVLKDYYTLNYDRISNIPGHTYHYLNMKKLSVKRFVATFTGSGVSQLNIQHIQHDEKDEQCLSDLYITYPFTDKKDIERRNGGLLEGSYRWILSHENFLQFLNENKSPILWIKGDPGKGKTMLLCGIIDELAQHKSVSLSYFFCQATNYRLSTATSVLRGLIYHLALYNPYLTKHVRNQYDYKKDLFKGPGAWYELCEILTSMLNDVSLKNAILIVDALDECRVDQKLLLEFITKPSRAKWIVSSRNRPDIEEILDDVEQKLKIHLEINQESVSIAVNYFIDIKVHELAEEKNYDMEMERAVLEHLRLNANGTFLWVSLVCQELSGQKSLTWQRLNELKLSLTESDSLYRSMLEHINQHKDPKLCKDILATALVLYRSVTVEELHLLVEGLQNFDREEAEEAIKSCGSFLTIRSNSVSFVRQPAHDYFLKECLREILPSSIADQHRKVFTRSLDLLHDGLKRDIYGLNTPGCLIDEVNAPQPDPLAAIRYSCTFWVNHLLDSRVDVIASENDEILDFFKKGYLHWLEALSLLNQVSIAGKAMQQLEAYLQGKGSQNLQDIVRDARRFLLLHGGVIEMAPLQVYVSALIFSPTNSLIRETFTHEEPQWIEVKPRVEENWDACQPTLEGHDRHVTSVVFSNDGQRLASGSRDKTVKIWDATSGTCLQTLESHSSEVTSIAFSKDGQRLASGSRDKTVKIWDATSGECLQTLGNHSSEVTSVALSNDGQRLASGSDDKTVKIWDTTSGACLKTLEGHSGSVTSVAFSNDGQRLASGSWDKTVKIWDPTSGTCLQTLESHASEVTSVALSNDGQRLASGSDDETVKIWDTTSGACLKTLEGHSWSVTSVAFSTDGQRLVSGSDDKTLRVWNVTSGTCLQTLEGHNGGVTSVVFSNDGQQLASGSDDNTVKIWDVAFSPCPHTAKSHDESVTSVAFSNDGKRLASGSDDHTVKIWDVTSGACLGTLEGHSWSVTSVAFSNDGQRLVSGSDDKTLRVWNVASGKRLWTLEGHNGGVTSVVFSKDGQRLASRSDDNTFKIWDVTSSKCLHTLENHCWPLSLLVMSNNDQRLASGSNDKTVRIWDATSGKLLHTFHDLDYYEASVVLSDDGQRLASGSLDNTIKIWDATSDTCLRNFQAHDYYRASAALSKDGQLLASGSDDNTVKIWSTYSGALAQTLKGHHRPVISMTFSNDGQKLASGSADHTVKIWNTTSSECLHTLRGHRHLVRSVAFSNDGQRLASGSLDMTIKIWNAASGECLQTLEGHTWPVTSVMFSKNGQQLASRSDGETTKIWDVNSGVFPQTVGGHNWPVALKVSSSSGHLLELGPSPDKTFLFESKLHSYSLSIDGVWVMRDHQRVLWLPPSYRPIKSAVAEKGVGLGTASGRITIIGFGSNG